MKNLFLIFPMVLLFGCNEYTAQMCTEDVRADVAGLEGTWKFVGYGNDLQVTNSSAKIKRLAKGVYLAEGKREALFTCQLNGNTYLEQQIQNGHWNSYVLTNNGKGFDLTITLFDKAAVEASGIPFTVEIVEEEQKLIVDNAKATDSKKVGDLLSASSFNIRMYP